MIALFFFLQNNLGYLQQKYLSNVVLHSSLVRITPRLVTNDNFCEATPKSFSVKISVAVFSTMVGVAEVHTICVKTTARWGISKLSIKERPLSICMSVCMYDRTLLPNS